ncbi:hypothetical protein EDB89DRAFT_1913681 [Lactarius sanguifluus]|nr:hypothetical protein EDB89DRAFT_1913681 [Lactarius sanguifluus]
MVVSWWSRSCVLCWGGAVGWQWWQWPATSMSCVRRVGGGGWGSDERKKEKKTHLNEAEAELVVSRGLACRDGMLGGKDFRMAGWWWLKLAWGKRWRRGEVAATMTWLCDSGERYHVTAAALLLRHTSAHGPRLHLQHPPPVSRHAKAPIPTPAVTTAPLYAIREAHHHTNSLPTSPRDYPPRSSHCHCHQPTAPPQHSTQDLDRQPTTMPPQHGTPRLGRRARPCRPATPLQRDTQGPSHHRPPRHVDTARNTPPPADSMPRQDPATADLPRCPNAACRTLPIHHAAPTQQLLPRHDPSPTTATLALLPLALAGSHFSTSTHVFV